MNELARASWILFQAHLLRTVRTRRGLIAFGLAAVPVALAALISVVTRIEGESSIEAAVTLVWLLIHPVVPLIALVLASGVIAEEIEDRTITYLFTRPIPRQAILLGRWLAVALPIVVLATLSSELVLRLLAEAGSARPGEPWMPAGFHARVLLTAALAGTVYSAAFAAAGALFKRALLVGLAYTFVYEGFLGNLPGANQKATILFYLRSFLFVEHPGLGGEMEEAILTHPLVSSGSAVLGLALILVGVLALGAWRFARREYVLAA